MGTVVTFDLFDPDGVSLEALSPHLTKACSVLHDADRVFSTYRVDSPISRLRRGELTVDGAPAEVAEVLDACRIARDLSGGWFDPWAMPGGVDPTGYVKGWAAQRALCALAPSGVRGALVNAAGDVVCSGTMPGGAPFRIGIVEPADPTRLACVVELDQAIATSGTYERGQHLVDPRTGVAGSRAASASVCGPDLGLADALATALAVGGAEVLERLEALEEYEALMIATDGTRSWTSRFPFAPTPRSEPSSRCSAT
jgi:FAD:protein FMN transferase